MRINGDSCPMQSWCELFAIYGQSFYRMRKDRNKVLLKDLYIINSSWATNTRLNIKLGRGLSESFSGIAAHEAALKYGNWVVDGYCGNNVILYKLFKEDCLMQYPTFEQVYYINNAWTLGIILTCLVAGKKTVERITVEEALRKYKKRRVDWFSENTVAFKLKVEE